MFRKICTTMVLSLVMISSYLSATSAKDYEIHDIGTLQTRESQAIALNNQGQILGWYNIDKTPAGKHFFVRDKDGTFSELPSKENGVGVDINWRYLKDDGKAYGTFDGNTNYSVLYVWDQKNGVVKLGNLPGKEISAINNAGQVLIKSIVENESGKMIRRPVIWHNGKITKLNGLEGDTGIPSDESYGLDMNNKGEVAGQSVIYLSYKNELYKQIHATKWVNGEVIDLHRTIPKSTNSCAIAINIEGDFLIKGYTDNNTSYSSYILYLVGDRKIYLQGGNGSLSKLTDSGCAHCQHAVVHKSGNQIISPEDLNKKLQNDFDSIWMKASKIIDANDNGEVIAQGETIYGEEHTMLLTPVKPK